MVGKDSSFCCTSLDGKGLERMTKEQTQVSEAEKTVLQEILLEETGFEDSKTEQAVEEEETTEVLEVGAIVDMPTEWSARWCIISPDFIVVDGSPGRWWLGPSGWM